MTALPGVGLAQNDDPIEAWARVLARFVDDSGAVAFAELADDPRDLETYVNYIARVSPASDPAAFPTADDRLAYYINSYNALAMYNVLEYGIPESLGFFRRFAFFYRKEFTIGGRELSLYDYENEVIRPHGDERVHFALNCMTVACPVLPREPFYAEGLQAALDDAARTFFSQERNLRVDETRQTVRVSEILDFYKEDFLAVSDSLIAYVNRYVEPDIPAGYQLEFIDYDWTVNARSGGGQ